MRTFFRKFFFQNFTLQIFFSRTFWLWTQCMKVLFLPTPSIRAFFSLECNKRLRIFYACSLPFKSKVIKIQWFTSLHYFYCKNIFLNGTHCSSNWWGNDIWLSKAESYGFRWHFKNSGIHITYFCEIFSDIFKSIKMMMCFHEK